MMKEASMKRKIRNCIKLITGIVTLMLLLGVFRVESFAYENIVVCIDPGHGGAVSEGIDDAHAGAMYHDLMEKDVNLITAKALRDELLEYGNVTVYMTRENDKELSLEERVNYAISVGADVLISVHYNASADHNFFGSEIFTSAFGECYAKGRALAGCIMDEWEDYGNIRKDIKTRIGDSGADYYGLIRNGTAANLPTIILEHAYLDNDRDYLRIKEDGEFEELGRCDARGIAKYYGLEKNLVKNQIGPTVRVEVPDDVVRPDDTAPEDVNLTVNKYNRRTGKVDFSLTASDPDSKLMYYGFVTGEVDDDTVFPELELWEGSHDQVKGSYKVKPGYEGKLTAVVFNVYQLDTKSNSVELTLADSVDEEEEADEDEESMDSDTKDEDAANKDNALKDDKDKASDNKDTKDKLTNVISDIAVDGNKSSQDDRLEKAIQKAIDNEEGRVEESYKKLLIVGLVAAVIFVVSMVVLVSSASRKRRMRRKRARMEETGYDWDRRR